MIRLWSNNFHKEEIAHNDIRKTSSKILHDLEFDRPIITLNSLGIPGLQFCTDHNQNIIHMDHFYKKWWNNFPKNKWLDHSCIKNDPYCNLWKSCSCNLWNTPDNELVFSSHNTTRRSFFLQATSNQFCRSCQYASFFTEIGWVIFCTISVRIAFVHKWLDYLLHKKDPWWHFLVEVCFFSSKHVWRRL